MSFEVVVVVITLTRIIKSVVTGQAPVTLELRNTPGKNTNKPKVVQYWALFSAGTCTERLPALNRAPGTIANIAKTALLRAGQSLTSGTGTNEVVFDLWCSAHACGVNRERNGSILLLSSEVPAWAWADFLSCVTCGANLWSPQEFVVK